MRRKLFWSGPLLALLLAPSVEVSADDRFAITYATFDAQGYDNCRQVVDDSQALGLRAISLVPTYYHEHRHEIRVDRTPPVAVIGDCLRLLLDRGFRVIYKPHLDPVRYLWGYDIFASDNASWRVNVAWRGFFDLDPMTSGYYETVLQPILVVLAEIREQRGSAVGLKPVRLELGAELMTSVIRHGDAWLQVARRARRFIDSSGLDGLVRLSHNFSHHIQIEEDFLLGMRRHEKIRLRKYLESLDDIAVSQYMDLTIRLPQEGSLTAQASAVADAILFYQERFRRLILDHHLGMKRATSVPVHIGEFGVGVGGLKHPNYWEGREVDPQQQEIGIRGLLEVLKRTEDLPAEAGLTATLWTVGPAYDIFGTASKEGENPAAVEQIQAFLLGSE